MAGDAASAVRGDETSRRPKPATAAMTTSAATTAAPLRRRPITGQLNGRYFLAARFFEAAGLALALAATGSVPGLRAYFAMKSVVAVCASSSGRWFIGDFMR